MLLSQQGCGWGASYVLQTVLSIERVLSYVDTSANMLRLANREFERTFRACLQLSPEE